MRSASWGVVIEPSTRDRSYGPFTIFREASEKFPISISSATARSSSSQSRRLSWQPSQEANFQTASLGFLIRFISELAYPDEWCNSIVPKNRTLFADELRTQLAVAAKADRAFHVPLHRDIDLLFF